MVSDTWLEKLGYSRNEVIGRHSDEFVTGESRQQFDNIYWQQAFKGEHVKNVSFTMMRKNGETFDVLLSATSEKDSGGNVLTFFAVLIDVADINQQKISS